MDSRGSSHRTPYMPRIRNADENRISSPSANANNGSQRSSTGSAMLRASPYSPFPFGLPIQSSNRSILSPGSIDQELSRNEDVNKKDQFSSDTNNDTSSLHTFRRRVRAQDVYGGKYEILIPNSIKTYQINWDCHQQVLKAVVISVTVIQTLVHQTQFLPRLHR